MKKSMRNLLKVLMFTIICVCSLNVAVYAAGGDGTGNGDGSGTGRDKALVLKECSIEDGSVDLPKDLNIDLIFNKNVADLSVSENNEKAISIKDKDGNSAVYTVIFPEEHEKRRMIMVSAELEPSKDYVLTVSHISTSIKFELFPEDITMTEK